MALKTPDQKTIEWLMESCPVRSVLSGGMGFLFGGMFGLFIAGTSPTLENQDPTKMKVKEMVRIMGRQTLSYAQNFAIVGASYSGSECVIESYRAKHDIYNAVSAGCFTGGILGVRAGPQAAALGCAGFAAFSAAIEYYLEHSALSRD